MYGFHKTKYDDSEHCFAHKNFRRDNKRLLLQMQRKTKGLTAERRSEYIDHQEPSIKEESNIMDIVMELQAQVRDQDEKIKQLINANKEFKTACIAMYSELETIKGIAKCDVENNGGESQTPTNQTATNQGTDIALRNTHPKVENSEMINMFNNFVGNLMSNVNSQQRNNILYGRNNDFIFKYETTYNKDLFNNQQSNYMRNETGSTSKQTSMTFGNVYNSRERNMSNVSNFNRMNVPVNNMDNYENPRKTGKRLRSPSPVGMQEWRRVVELQDDSLSNYSDRIPASPDPSKYKFIRKSDHYYQSDFEEVPKRIKQLDNMSVGSAPRMSGYHW